MRAVKSQYQQLLLLGLGLVPTVWLAILIAPFVDDGLLGIIVGMGEAMDNPFHLTWVEDTFRCVLFFIAAYLLGIAVYTSSQRNYRRREEHGSAKWGEMFSINKKYQDKPRSANKLLTSHVCIGLNGKKHRRNLNTLVVGGSGAGKTRFYAKPNIMQGNTSFVVLDPNGRIVLL